MITLFLLIVSIIIILLLVHSKCNFDCTSCPNITADQNATTPLGKCLLKCDNENDSCYKNCNGNESCIATCYKIKTACYTNCLGPLKETFIASSCTDCQ
jgi:hypothetical protein